MMEDYHFPALQNTTLPRVLMQLYRTAESRATSLAARMR